MRDEFKELLEKWEERRWDYRDPGVPRHLKPSPADAVTLCMDELKDTLLLIEANDIATGGQPCKPKTS